MKSDDFFQITGGQIRAARAFLRWSAEDLARQAKVGVATVRRSEAQDGVLSATPANIQAMRQALEAAGVEFLNHGRPGVRLREPASKADDGVTGRDKA